MKFITTLFFDVSGDWGGLFHYLKNRRVQTWAYKFLHTFQDNRRIHLFVICIKTHSTSGLWDKLNVDWLGNSPQAPKNHVKKSIVSLYFLCRSQISHEPTRTILFHSLLSAHSTNRGGLQSTYLRKLCPWNSYTRPITNSLAHSSIHHPMRNQVGFDTIYRYPVQSAN